MGVPDVRTQVHRGVVRTTTTSITLSSGGITRYARSAVTVYRMAYTWTGRKTYMNDTRIKFRYTPETKEQAAMITGGGLLRLTRGQCDDTVIR